MNAPSDSTTDLTARLALLERRYRRLRAVLWLLAVPMVALVGLAATQRPPQVLEAERLVLRSPDSASYADIELAGRNQLRFWVFANLRGTPRPPTDTLVAASPGAGLDLVAGVNPALVLTTGDGTEVIRLERGVRPVGQ
jgi:hypothetical protein